MIKKTYNNIFVDTDPTLFLHLLNCARIPGYVIPQSFVDNVAKLAVYFGFKLPIKQSQSKRVLVLKGLFQINKEGVILSHVVHVTFRIICDDSSTHYPFYINYVNGDETIKIVNIYDIAHETYVGDKYSMYEVSHEILPIFQNSFISLPDPGTTTSGHANI